MRSPMSKKITIAKMKKMIVDRIKEGVGGEQGGVTFAQLVCLEGARGRTGIFHLSKDRGEVLLWCNVSRTFARALSSLMKNKIIHYEPTAMLTYIVDGLFLKFPVCKRLPPIGGYRKTHWLPVAFNLGPLPPW